MKERSLNTTGPYAKLVAQALLDGAVYVYACDGDATQIVNLAGEFDPLAVDSDVLRNVAFTEEEDLVGCEFSRVLDRVPGLGHAESPRSHSFHGVKQFSAQIFCRRTSSFTNGRVLAGITANGGGLGLVTPSVFTIGVNGEVQHGLLTTGNPNNQVAMGTGSQALNPYLYTATWDADLKLHALYRDADLHAVHTLPNAAGLHDPAGPRGIAIGGCPTLGNRNADAVIGFYALYPCVLTAEEIGTHYDLLYFDIDDTEDDTE